MFMVITVLLSHGKGVKYCMSDLNSHCIPDLLQQQLPGSAKHVSTISAEVHGT